MEGCGCTVLLDLTESAALNELSGCGRIPRDGQSSIFGAGYASQVLPVMTAPARPRDAINRRIALQTLPVRWNLPGSPHLRESRQDR